MLQFCLTVVTNTSRKQQHQNVCIVWLYSAYIRHTGPANVI